MAFKIQVDQSDNMPAHRMVLVMMNAALLAGVSAEAMVIAMLCSVAHGARSLDIDKQDLLDALALEFDRAGDDTCARGGI